MAKKKIIAFTPADNRNLIYYERLKNSLRKFHSEEELPLKLIGLDKIASYKDNDFFYRATPLIARELMHEYETIIKLDADQIITGPINQAWEGDFDVAVVNNSNPKEFKAFPYQFINIHPFSYVNCGFVVMKSPDFITFWDNFCHGMLFRALQMREQDILNILIQSNNYRIKRLDEGDSFWGLASKGYWSDITLKDGQLFLPKGDEWPDKDKYIKVIHWAGGNDPNKMALNLYFQPEVVTHLEKLIKP